MQASFAEQLEHDRRRTTRHGGDRRTAIASGGERCDVGAGRAGNFVPCDVRFCLRFAEHTSIDEHYVAPTFTQALTQVLVLHPLSVERAD